MYVHTVLCMVVHTYIRVFVYSTPMNYSLSCFQGSALPSHFGPICAKAQSLLSVPAKGKGASKRIGSVSKMSSTESQEVDGNVPANDTKDVGGEGQEYKESKSYFLIDISLSKPLVPRRPLNVLAQRYVHTCVRICT